MDLAHLTVEQVQAAQWLIALAACVAFGLVMWSNAK